MKPTKELPFYKSSKIFIDPRTKIFLTITVSTIMVTGSTGGLMNFVRPCLVFFPIILFLTSERIKMSLRFLLTYTILFLIEVFMLPLLHGALGFLFGAVVGIYTHMLPGFVMGYYLIETTTVSEFTASMERMKVSQKIVIPISVVFRLFPTIREEYTAINNAMKMRGIASIRHPLQMIEYRVVPLMMSVVKIGEELSAAALTRGLGADVKRTNICKIGFGIIDIAFFLLSILCWVGFFIT